FSISAYNKVWADAQEALDVLLQRERENKSLKPEQDHVTTFKTLATYYIKYVQIFRDLETAYDQIVHPQKRPVIRQVLEGVMGRILELKNDMVTLENSEYHYFDDILQDLQLLPIVTLILCCVHSLLAVLLKKPVKSMAFEEAIKTIQVAERARQGRLRATFMKQLYLEEKRERQAKLQGKMSPNPDDAATCIQKIWRGYIQRKKTEKIREEEMIFLGMCPPPHFQTTSTSLLHAREVNTLQDEVQERHEEEYQKALVYVKDSLKELEGLDIKETLQDQIRQHFIEACYFHAANNLIKAACYPFFLPPEAVGETNGFCNFSPLFSFFSITAIWKNRDERWNFPQEHDPELIKEEKREEVEEEIRVQVDKLMRQELKNLRLVVDKEESNEQKKGKKSEKLGAASRENKVKLSSSLPRCTGISSQVVHKKAPLVKAMLLAGPTGVGKKMLVHAICTETGANLFNLSASNIAGKYLGKNGLQMMLHMVFKVAKQLQPSVLWIGDTEKTFYKKVPKAEEEMDPKRLKEILPKYLEVLKAEDRVLLVGTTRRPFDADLRPFCKVYQKIILIPRPDYASRFVLWKHIILQNGGIFTKTLNISCLAKLSDGFTQGHILQAVQTVLSKRRILQMTKKPLTAVEFMTALARQDPVYKEEEETFKAWYTETPLGKARIKALAGSEEAGKGKAKGKKKEGSKDKKKK
uniref:IQ motif containing with AAA domain 1 n=1 Tax=Apteryx owenii TaxID=8824 RepID=A0A8B9P1D3_APTOW